MIRELSESGAARTYRVDWVDIEVLAAEVWRRSRSNDDFDLLFGGHFGLINLKFQTI